MKTINQISCLTPLRGIAALLIILFHYNFFVTPVIDPQQMPFVDKLYLMVDLFFVLSGFIMCHVYGETFEAGVGKKSMFEFLGARFARIYPLHLATLLLTIVVVFIVRKFTSLGPANNGVRFDISAIYSHFLMLQGMGTHHEATWNSPAWSISVEWWVYILFPFMAAIFANTKSFSRWIALLFVIASYLLIMYCFQPAFWAERWRLLHIPAEVPFPLHTIDVLTGYSAFLRCLCGFVIGMLAYEIFKLHLYKNVLRSGYVFIAIWIILFVLWSLKLPSDLVAVFLFGLMILSAAYNDDWLSKVLNTKFFKHMGDISYSLYLVHMILVLSFASGRAILVLPDPLLRPHLPGFLFPPLEAWVGLIIMFSASIALASLSYAYIEKPARIYLNSKIKHKMQL